MRLTKLNKVLTLALASSIVTTTMAADKAKEKQASANKIAALDEEFLAFLASSEVIDEKVTDPLDMLDIDALDGQESKDIKKSDIRKPGDKNVQDSKNLKKSDANGDKLEKEKVEEER